MPIVEAKRPNQPETLSDRELVFSSGVRPNAKSVRTALINISDKPSKIRGIKNADRVERFLFMSRLKCSGFRLVCPSEVLELERELSSITVRQNSSILSYKIRENLRCSFFTAFPNRSAIVRRSFCRPRHRSRTGRKDAGSDSPPDRQHSDPA